MPIGRTVFESLQGDLADERSFGFQQWSKTSDGCWVVQSSGQCEPSMRRVDSYALGLVTFSISLSFI